jgi:hypothetical protein
VQIVLKEEHLTEQSSDGGAYPSRVNLCALIYKKICNFQIYRQKKSPKVKKTFGADENDEK